MPPAAVTAVPAPRAPGCPCGCESRALVSDGFLVGLEGASLRPPCRICLDAARAVLSAGRPRVPLRPSRAQRHSGSELVASRWDEAIDRLVMCLESPARGEGRLVVLCGGDEPRATDVLALRLASLVPDSIVLRRTPHEEAIARWASAALEERHRADPEDLASADVILAWQEDVLSQASPARAALDRARASGARLVSVSSAHHQTADQADPRVFIAPGSDVALLLGLATEMGSAASEWTPPERAAIAAWPVQRAAAAAGIDVSEIAELGGLLSRARRPVLIAGAGAPALGAGGFVRALAVAARAAGARAFLPRPAIDPVGGFAGALGPHAFALEPSGRWGRVLGDLDLASCTVVSLADDPLATWPGGARLAAVLSHAEAVLAVSPWVDALARAADLWLPTASHLERADILGSRCGERHRHVPRILDPPRGVRTAGAVLRQLALRLGWPAEWFPEASEELLSTWDGSAAARAQFASVDLSGPIEPRLHGETPLLEPALSRDYPLALVAAMPPSRATQRMRDELPTALMAADDADSRDIESGRAVVVASRRGRLRALAIVDDGAPSGTVSVSAQGGLARAGALWLLPPPTSRDGEVLGGCLVDVHLENSD